MNIARMAIVPAILVATSAPLAAQDGVVDLDTAIHCSAAFRMIAYEQEHGIGTASTDYPPLNVRGKEFFVQTAARLMDEQKLGREQTTKRFADEIRKLRDEAAKSPDPKAAVRAVMTPCLTLLDATVPPSR